jgi:hypothetical protein
MAESYTQVPPNSTGNKLRTRTRTIGANDVHEQAVFTAALPTYYALADTVALAANKHHISIFNASGSGVVVSVKKLFQINLSLASVTGVALRFDMKRTTAQSAGTAITPQSMDTDNPALPAQVTVNTNGTITEGALLYPYTTQNDEVSAANTAVANYLTQYNNLALESTEMQELRLREGQGFTVKQITSSTVGSFAWLMAFTVEPTS